MEDPRRALRETYDRIAPDWHRDHALDTWWHDAIDTFLTSLPAGGSIIDIGCGAGHTAKYMTDHGFHVTGVDFSEKMIDIVRREVPNAEFITLDMYDTASIGKQFDGAVMKASLLHIPKRDVVQILRGVRDVLRPGGTLFIAVKETRPGQAQERVEREQDYGYAYERAFTYFAMPELQEFLHDAGFEVSWTNISKSNQTNWIRLIARVG